MDYKELKKVYYGNFEAYEREYQQRLEGYGTIVTQLYPRLMKRKNFQTSSFPPVRRGLADDSNVDRKNYSCFW